MKYGHLERLNLSLRTLGPVFIGSGEGFNKKEYIFDVANGRIHFPDWSRLMVFLKSRSLLPAYQSFLTNPRQNDFRAFLESKGVKPSDYQAFVLYSISAGEAARSDKFREVLTFIKDAHGRPYIPGSSLKGAIRTALAAWFIEKGNYEREKDQIEKADSSQSPRRYLSRENNNLEKKIFYRLDIRDHKGQVVHSPINDFMRAIRISDSAPLGFENLILTGKYDRKPDGTVNLLPIFRECLIPGCEVRFQMTLDLPMLEKVNLGLNDIEDALHLFADTHYANYEQHFGELPEDAAVAARQGVDVILGGGAGYVSKTLTYNLFTKREEALRMVARIMTKNFPRHGHTNDVARYKVSPHILKTTMYKEKYYPMGRCELIWR
jgi:CRISPR-associated protein Csm5